MSKEADIEESELAQGAQLNLYQQYRRTTKLDKTTSRMKNKDWYRDALDLDVQLHCYVSNESEVGCYLHIKSQQHYEEIGQLNLQQLHKYEDQEVFIQEILARDSVVAAKPKSLGVIFYLADEISFAGLGPEYQDPDELLNLSEQLLDDPRAVLEDKTVSTETHAWRLFPYSGASDRGGEFATAVAVPRKLEPILANFRKVGNSTNFPIRTSALSAPLCAVASLPWCASVSPQGTVAIFNYSKFTLLAFFNNRCDLVMLRHVAHAQGASVPRNLGPIVFSAATSYELENPEVYILPMIGGDMQGVILSLQTSMKESAVMLVDSADILQSRGVTVPIPLEMMTTTHDLDPAIYPLAGNTTFKDFKQAGWTVQNFLTPSQEEQQSYPSAAAMLLLKISRLSKVAVALILAGILAYAGMDVAKKITSESWHFKKENSQAQLAGLQKKVSEYQRWDVLLTGRSKGWVSMELLSEFVPEDGSMVLTSANYKSAKPSDKKVKHGIVKTWTISGKTTEKRYQELDASYNTRDPKAMKELFRKVAESTGDTSYSPDVDGRKLSVLFSRKSAASGSSRSGGASEGFPISFTLSVTLRYSKNDTVALTGIK